MLMYFWMVNGKSDQSQFPRTIKVTAEDLRRIFANALFNEK